MTDILPYVYPYKSIPVICGPTASGKSSLAFDICKRTKGELFSMDSMQIYKGMDIGTAKDSVSEQEIIRHRLMDLLQPSENFTPVQYLQTAYADIEDALSLRHLPVFCGGTGQYASALAEGIEYVPISVDPAIRESILQFAEREGWDALYGELCLLDPVAAEKIHPNNHKRVIRAIEIYRQTGKSISYHNEVSKTQGPKYPFSLFVIQIPRDTLYQRIEERVDQMIENGLIDEADKLYQMNLTPEHTAMQAIGYKELFDYFAGRITISEAVTLIKKNTRNYAKRQITWFRHMENVTWISPDDADIVMSSISISK